MLYSSARGLGRARVAWLAVVAVVILALTLPGDCAEASQGGMSPARRLLWWPFGRDDKRIEEPQTAQKKETSGEINWEAKSSSLTPEQRWDRGEDPYPHKGLGFGPPSKVYTRWWAQRQRTLARVKSNWEACTKIRYRIKTVDISAYIARDLTFRGVLECYSAKHAPSATREEAKCLMDWGPKKKIWLDEVPNNKFDKDTTHGQYTWDKPIEFTFDAPFGANAIQCEVRTRSERDPILTWRSIPHHFLRTDREFNPERSFTHEAIARRHFRSKHGIHLMELLTKNNIKPTGPMFTYLTGKTVPFQDLERHNVLEVNMECLDGDKRLRPLAGDEFDQIKNRLARSYHAGADSVPTRKNNRSKGPGRFLATKLQRPYVFAHRAVSQVNQMENSAEALEVAARAKWFKGVEIDVFLFTDKNGKDLPIISHENHLNRLIGFDGELSQLTSTNQLDVLTRVTQCTTMFRPLKEYLKRIKESGMMADVELKPGNPLVSVGEGYYQRLGVAVGKDIRETDTQDHVIVSSFEPRNLLPINKGGKGAHIKIADATYVGAKAWLLRKWNAAKAGLGIIGDLAIDGHVYHWSLVNKELVERHHAKGEAVGAYTIYDSTEPRNGPSHNKEMIKTLIASGVDWIESDNPIQLSRDVRVAKDGMHELSLPTISRKFVTYDKRPARERENDIDLLKRNRDVPTCAAGFRHMPAIKACPAYTGKGDSDAIMCSRHMPRVPYFMDTEEYCKLAAASAKEVAKSDHEQWDDQCMSRCRAIYNAMKKCSANDELRATLFDIFKDKSVTSGVGGSGYSSAQHELGKIVPGLLKKYPEIARMRDEGKYHWVDECYGTSWESALSKKDAKVKELIKFRLDTIKRALSIYQQGVPSLRQWVYKRKQVDNMERGIIAKLAQMPDRKPQTEKEVAWFRKADERLKFNKQELSTLLAATGCHAGNMDMCCSRLGLLM